MGVENLLYIMIGLQVGVYGMMFAMNTRLSRIEGAVLNGKQLLRVKAFDSKPEPQEDKK